MAGEPSSGEAGTGTDELAAIRANARDAGKNGAGAISTSSSTASGEPDSPLPETGEKANPEKVTASPWKRRVLVSAIIAVLVAAGVVIPPLINIGTYKHQVAALMSRSLGRPVRMSSVELRLLPFPGFVLHDLSVSEDPGFGAEPILVAGKVVASVRLQSLWRGKLEIDRVSVDDASLNLVRSAQGKWNLDSLVMGAPPELTGRGGASPGATAKTTPAHLPYLEATESRVNLKFGAEKSPYSLVDTDLSFWQDAPGEWRVRLRGQPVRTDLAMSLADTGQVRMEATLHNAPLLREMPLKLQVEWRDAQLGQLSRMLFGSDAGWRGDVTADIDVQGTPDNAQTKARLRATSVRREEFVPDTPLDFDANCNFLYEHSHSAVHGLDCNTAIGDGRLHLKADLPGGSGAPEAMLEAKDLPVQAGLDLMRTIRSDFAPGISAKGSANGSLTYRKTAEDTKNKPVRKPARSIAAKQPAATADLVGSLVVDGVVLRGGGLKENLALPRFTLMPALLPDGTHNGPAQATGLSTHFIVPVAPVTPAQTVPATVSGGANSTSSAASGPTKTAGASPAQTISVQLSLGANGYEAVVGGSAGIAMIRDRAYAFGLPHQDAVDAFGPGIADFQLAAKGPWIPAMYPVAVSQPASTDTANSAQKSQSASSATKSSLANPAVAGSGSGASVTPSLNVPKMGLDRDTFSGSIAIRHTQWNAPYLARPVDLSQTSISFSGASMILASDFSLGIPRDAGKAESAVKGSVSVNASTNCSGPDCAPQVRLRFGALDGIELQAALLGVPKEKSLLSPLIERMRSSNRPKWPEVAVNAQADSLALGSVVLQKPLARLQFKTAEVTIEDWEAGLLGGSAKGTGSFAWSGDKPEYSFKATLSGIDAAQTGALLNSSWSGNPIRGSGDLQISGLTPKDLTASAVGDLHFDWPHGGIAASNPASILASNPNSAPDSISDPHQTAEQEVRFDDWSGTVAIQGGKAQLGENVLLSGHRNSTATGVIPFGGPVKLTITPSVAQLPAHAGKAEPKPAVK